MRALGAAALVWSAILAGPVVAQDGTPASPGASATTGSSGSTVPASGVQRVGAVTAVGKTKPPGAPLGENLGTRPDLQEKSRQLDRRITTGICSGCR